MLPTQPTLVSAPSESTWRIILREVNGAPKQARRAILVSALGLVVGIALAVYDLVTGTNAEEIQRLIALFLAVIGSLFLVIAQVLHQVSQGMECGVFEMPTVKQKRFHRAQVGLPLLAAMSMIFMSSSIGMFIPAIRSSPLVLLLIAFISFYLVYAIRLIQHTTHFLYRHATEQAEMAARAQAQATEAQLAALRAQMNPHFLFNALNTVASLVRTNSKQAERTVEDLADVLRHTLDRSQSNNGTVAEEIEYLRAYLAVEQQRFGSRLKVDWQLDKEALPLNLPPLTLQPLVENALKHGIGARIEGGLIQVEAVRNNGHLTLTVTDNGVGFPPRHRESTGLGNLRQRLKTLYGAAHELRIDSTAAGSKVTVQIPVQNAPAAVN